MSRLNGLLKKSKTAIIAAVLSLLVIVAGAAQGLASKSDLMDVVTSPAGSDPTLTLVQGMAEVVELPGPVADVMVADPSVINVSALQSNRLYIVGSSLGFTNVLAVDENGDLIKRLNVMVTIDTGQMQRMIHRLFPEEDIQVEALRGQVILKGTAANPDSAQRIENLVLHHITEIEGSDGTADEKIVNLMKIKGKSQVMLQVKVVEISRTLLRARASDTQIQDLGIDFGDNVQNSGRLGNVFSGVLNSATPEPAFAAFGILESFGGFGPIDTVLSLLENEGLAKIVAEPNLTAISGEQAGFFAGGEFPIPAGIDENGNIAVEMQRFGASLAFQPVVLSEDRISLQFDTEVSNPSRENQLILPGLAGNTIVPGRDVRSATTTVELGSGQTLMIAGLLQSNAAKALSGLPGATEMPIIGDLFSSKSFDREETELVVLVTPYLVEPFSDKKTAEKVPQKENDQSGLADAFSRNIRRTYGDLKMTGLFEGDKSFGYLID